MSREGKAIEYRLPAVSYHYRSREHVSSPTEVAAAEKFEHPWPLLGKHAQLTCNQCHWSRKGAGYPIEQRDAKEVSHIFGKALAPKGMKVFNPAFDVTAQELVTAIITERGVINPPYQQNIRSHVSH